MAWTTVKNWSNGVVVDDSDLDTYISDNTQYLYDVRFGAGHRNVLVNPQMEVWQAGTSLAITSSATPQYLADQWCTRRNGATGATVSRQTGPTGQQYAMRVQRDSGNSNTTAIETMQPLETPEAIKLAGQTCQLKLNLKAGANFSAASSLVTVKVTYGTGTDQAPPASGWTGTTDALSTTQAITTTATDYTFDSINIPTSATQVQVYVAFTPVGTASTNDWFELAGAQLTAGKMATWERLPMATQLVRCQRFWYSINGSGTDSDVGIVGMIFGTTGGTFTWKHPVEMRTAPALTVDAASSWKVYDGSLQTGTVFTAGTCLTNSASFNLTVASGLTIGRGAKLVCASTSSRVYVNARL